MTRALFLLIFALAMVMSTSGATSFARTAPSAELAFTRVDGQHQLSVWVANADGSAARKVVAGGIGGRISSDGRWLAYSRLQDWRAIPLFVVSLSGGKPRRIGKVSGKQWSPHGAKLAISDDTGVLLVDPESGRRRRLVRATHVWQISFSPDGRAIAYARSNGRDGEKYRSDIFTVRLSDGVTTRLTRDRHSASPLWGPEWIVYQRLHWAGGLASQARLWLMRSDGSGKRMFARGAEGMYAGGFPVFGLDPLALSEDGRHLLACQAFEFGCRRITFTVPGGKRYGFPGLHRIESERGASAEDLSRDGARVLVDVGNPHSDRNHGIYEIPFAGGKLRLIADNAIEASWRH